VFGGTLTAARADNSDYQPELDSQGLIAGDSEKDQAGGSQEDSPDGSMVVKTEQPPSKQESLDKLQAGFNRLIEQLQGINDRLSTQAGQNRDLVDRVEQLPRILESFPAAMENQQKLTRELIGQLKTADARTQQFVETVQKIPAETARQTDALVNIDQQLAAAASTDVQMAENFNSFNDTLAKLNTSCASQTDSIMQMSRTFATSDRYLKYIISVQHKRFVWVFVAAISVCAAVILVLAGIIVYIRR
jgi:small-conductance mechanosensitive channel